MAERHDNFQKLVEIIILIAFIVTIAGYMFFVSMSFDTIDKEHGKCTMLKNSAVFSFGINYTQIELSTLSGLSMGTELLLRRLFEHFLKIYEKDNFVFSPASIYTSLSFLALNFHHDEDVVLQLQSAASILCDLDMLKLEMKKLCEIENLKNIIFLHQSYNEVNDASITMDLPFKLTSKLEKFSTLSNMDLDSSDYQTTVDLGVGYGEVKTAISTSGNFFPHQIKQDRLAQHEITQNITFFCPKMIMLKLSYLKSTLIECSSNGMILDIYEPWNPLSMEIFKSRFGGFQMTFTINEEIQEKRHEFKGPVFITLPNVWIQYSMDLNMPMQMFGLTNIFDEGVSRKGCDENLLSHYYVSTSKFSSLKLKESFEFHHALPQSAKRIFVSKPFFFSLRNNQSNVYHLFGYINNEKKIET